jgi:hypothetical protein
MTIEVLHVRWTAGAVVDHWETWAATSDTVHIVTDPRGKVIDRYTVRVDHDSGDEDGAR